MGFIYKITNKFNGKIYIGQTSKTLKERWKGHKFHKGCKYLNRAIKKYGQDNFTIEYICSVLKQEWINDTEILCIKQFNSLIPNGYNICIGGNAPMKNRKHTNKAKKKISKASIGKNKSNSHKQNISKSKIGILNPMFGKYGEFHHLSRKIYCKELDKVFNSIHEASRNLNLYPQNIHKVLNKIRKSTGGYTFNYIGDSNG